MESSLLKKEMINATFQLTLIILKLIKKNPSKTVNHWKVPNSFVRNYDSAELTKKYLIFL